MKQEYDPKVSIQLRIPLDLAKQLKVKADENLRSVNSQIVFYVQEGMKREEQSHAKS